MIVWVGFYIYLDIVFVQFTDWNRGRPLIRVIHLEAEDGDLFLDRGDTINPKTWREALVPEKDSDNCFCRNFFAAHAFLGDRLSWF